MNEQVFIKSTRNLLIQVDQKYNHSELRLLFFSPGPCAIYRTLSGERGQLKNLKVFLQRSPLAERKILEKANQPPESGKKNLDFEKNVSPSGQTGKIGKFKGFHQSSAEGARKHTRTTRAAVRTESESERSGYEREVDEEVCSGLDSSRSLSVFFFLLLAVIEL